MEATSVTSKYFSENVSKVMKLDLSERFYVDFYPYKVEINMINHFLFNFREELFSRYLVTPNAQTIEKCIVEMSIAMQGMPRDTDQSIFVFSCYSKAYDIFNEMLTSK